MKTTTQHIRASLLTHVGYTERFSHDLSSAWSREFERLMRNRLIQGVFRYGEIGAEGKSQFNRIADIQRRADRYQATGNLEYLVDIANLALLEFEEGNHPLKHFNSIDDGEHTK